MCWALLAFPLVVQAATPTQTTPHSGVLTGNFDPAVRIQDDLYHAVNGAWAQRTEIPADRNNWGAFHELRERSEQRSHEIILAAVSAPDDAEGAQIAALWRSFMDEAQAQALGAKPVAPLLAQIDAIKTRADLLHTLAAWQALHGAGLRLPVVIGVDQDARNAEQYLLSVHQSGLGLPDRDYYLEGDARFAKAREAYVAYLVRLFAATGVPADAAKVRAQGVLDLETRLAKIQWSRVANRDPQKRYNKYPLAQLGEVVPDFDWTAFFKDSGVQVTEANLNQPDYLKGLATLLQGESLDAWQDYLRASVLDGFAPYLSDTFGDAHFAFHGKALSGTPAQRERWKRGVSLVEGALGEAVGKRYVAKYFPPEAKAKMDVLVSNLFKAYASSIDGLTWMSKETKARAHEKLAAYQVKIGYPSVWRSYAGLELKAGDLVGNVERFARFEYAFDLGHLGKPVSRTEWHMTPQTVNAYYNATLNEIVFPAAILQPPFFDAAADDAVNYGGIGAVIGHEISHGFDDKGSQYDAKGNLRNWWTDADRAAFTELTTRLVKQYNAYEPIAGRHVNGELTLGENIADLSGLQIAYKAYRLSLDGKQAEVMDKLTGDQRFFIGFAQVWRNKTREDTLLQQLVTDPHSPGAIRPIGAAVNSDAFGEAFGVHPGDKMYKRPEERIRIW